ncbi:MAG TPA: molybdenum cofactor biosynthesis protein B [Gammaproteobacteria bacterium]|nr:molybdenum cofactor biosynthesis protein B [Gammaproteobacteria bacterium]
MDTDIATSYSPAEGFQPLALAILTVSDTRSVAEDRSGQTLAELAELAGHRVIERALVTDDLYAIRAVVSRWIADPAVQVVLTTGGTGVTGRDGTPEAVTVLLDKRLDGFGEVFRQLSFAEVGSSSLQSRALAGVANRTYVFCLPGSTGACRLAWEQLIRAQLDLRTRPCNLAQLLPRLGTLDRPPAP